MKKKGKNTSPDYLIQPSSPRASVDIKKASNGYVVSSYGPKGEMVMIAKDKKEMKQCAEMMLNKTKM